MEYRRSDNFYIAENDEQVSETRKENNPINELVHILDSRVFRAALIITIIVLFYLYY